METTPSKYLNAVIKTVFCSVVHRPPTAPCHLQLQLHGEIKKEPCRVCIIKRGAGKTQRPNECECEMEFLQMHPKKNICSLSHAADLIIGSTENERNNALMSIHVAIENALENFDWGHLINKWCVLRANQFHSARPLNN